MQQLVGNHFFLKNRLILFILFRYVLYSTFINGHHIKFRAFKKKYVNENQNKIDQ